MSAITRTIGRALVTTLVCTAGMHFAVAFLIARALGEEGLVPGGR